MTIQQNLETMFSNIFENSIFLKVFIYGISEHVSNSLVTVGQNTNTWWRLGKVLPGKRRLKLTSSTLTSTYFKSYNIKGTLLPAVAQHSSILLYSEEYLTVLMPFLKPTGESGDTEKKHFRWSIALMKTPVYPWLTLLLTSLVKCAHVWGNAQSLYCVESHD